MVLFLAHLEELAASITRELSAGRDVINICGPSGSGKSWIVSKVASNLAGDHGHTAIVRLQGDGRNQQIRYAPIDQYLCWKNKWKKGIGAFIEGTPYLGTGLKYLLEQYDIRHILKNSSMVTENKQLSRHIEFSKELLFLFKKTDHIIILCDDTHFFDESTIAYLQGLIPYFAKEGAKRISIIATYNTIIYHKTPYVFSRNDTLRFDLKCPSLEETLSLLEFWGMDALCAQNVVGKIYAATGGHLALLEQVSHYFAGETTDQCMSVENDSSFLRTLLEKRARETQSGDKVIELIDALATIGRQATIAELKCAMNNDSAIHLIVKDAVALNILSYEANVVSFINDGIRAIRRGCSHDDEVQFFSRYSNCLKILKPSEYERRSLSEELAGNHFQSQVMHALHMLKQIRAGYIPEQLLDNNDIIAWMNICTEAYRRSFAGKNDEALLFIRDHLRPTGSLLLDVEGKYAEFTFVFKTNRIEQRKMALSSLVGIIDSLDPDEVEIWARLMRLRIAFESSLDRIEIARFTYQEYQAKLLQRNSFDCKSEEDLYECQLILDSIFEPDIAHSQLLNMYHSLMRKIKDGNTKYIPLLYRAVVNLSGNDIIVGLWDEAKDLSLQAIKMVEEFTFMRFPNIGAVYNNYLLACYYLKSDSINDIVDGFQKVTTQNVYDEDELLLRLNHIGMLLQAGKNKAAKSLMESIDIDNDNSIDSYYAYYLLFNKAVVEYFAGGHTVACRMIDDLDEVANNSFSIRREYYKKHYSLVRQLFHEDTLYPSLHSMQRAFETRKPSYLSANWESFKSVYLFSDLQIWTQF